MANAIIYVDCVNGNNGNTGLSEAQAFADIPTAIAAISGGGNIIYVQAGSNYTLTSTIAFTASLKGDVTDGKNRIEGYTTTPGARDGRPTITSATNSVHLLTLNDNDYWEFVHLNLTHTAGTRGGAFTSITSNSTPVYIIDCVVNGCLSLFNAAGFISVLTLENTEVLNSTSTNAAIIAPSQLFLYGCDIHDNAGDGIRTTSGTTTILSILKSRITGAATIGVNDVSTSSIAITIHDSIVVNNGTDGVKSAAKAAGTLTLDLQNNIVYGSATGYGINCLDTQAETMANVRCNRNNAFGSNTSGPYVNLTAGYGEITLSADPFVNRAGRDYSLNTTAGGGVLLRAAAFPASFPDGSLNYRDIGAAQHQDAGGGGTVIHQGGIGY